MAFCTQCGSRLKDGAQFCTKCGNKVRQSATSSPRRQSPTITTPSPAGGVITAGTPARTPTGTMSVQTALSQKLANNGTLKDALDTETTERIASDTNTSPVIRDFEKESKEELRSLRSTYESPKNPEVVSDQPGGVGTSGMEFQKSPAAEPLTNASATPMGHPENKTPDSVTDIMKSRLEGLRFSFKTLDWVEPYRAATTFIAGSIRRIVWILGIKLELEVELTRKENSAMFTLHLPSDRPEYDWKNPFSFVEIEADQKLLIRIKRESRVIEKLTRLKGEIHVSVDRDQIRVKLDLDPMNLKPALEAVKEIAWMTDISLR